MLECWMVKMWMRTCDDDDDDDDVQLKVMVMVILIVTVVPKRMSSDYVASSSPICAGVPSVCL